MALELSGTTGVSLVQDGVVTTADIDDGAVTAGKLFSGFANGITEADMQRLTTDVTSNGDITSGFERPDDASYEKIGSGVTVSGGVFSFPSTGIYSVTVVGDFVVDGADTVQLALYASLDGGSNYDLVVQVQAGLGTGVTANSASGSFLIDVTDVSNVKLKLTAGSLSGSSVLKGNTDFNRTHISFIRLGDT